MLYLSMKNDISFLVSGTLNLYEHQSTYNPNMPMRGLLYYAKLYEKIIARNNINIYGSSAKMFPLYRKATAVPAAPDAPVLPEDLSASSC